jgi:hypothetical protein
LTMIKLGVRVCKEQTGDIKRVRICSSQDGDPDFAELRKLVSSSLVTYLLLFLMSRLHSPGSTAVCFFSKGRSSFENKRILVTFCSNSSSRDCYRYYYYRYLNHRQYVQ